MMPPPSGQAPRDEATPPRSERFRPHGRMTLWAEGAVVHVLAEGPFNMEAVDRFSDEMVAHYRQLPEGQRYVNLTEFRTSMMATPEAWERLATHLARVDGSGLPLVATAWIAAADAEGRACSCRVVRTFSLPAGARSRSSTPPRRPRPGRGANCSAEPVAGKPGMVVPSTPRRHARLAGRARLRLCLPCRCA